MTRCAIEASMSIDTVSINACVTSKTTFINVYVIDVDHTCRYHQRTIYQCIKLPVQNVPLPSNPDRHVQSKLPIVLLQLASGWQSLASDEAHSSMSKNVGINVRKTVFTINCVHYLP